MKYRKLLSVTLLCFFALAAAPSAQAMISLWGVGAVNDGMTNYTNSAGENTTTGLGFGGGLLIDLHLMPGLALETGALYLSNSFTTSLGGVSSSDSTGSFYVPADLRIHLAGPLSISGGAYYDAFTKSGYNADDGWEAGARLTFHGWFIDARYLHGIKDQGDGLEYRSILGLVGFRF